MGDLLYFAVLFGLGYMVGRRVEKRHYKSIEERESKFLNLPAVTSKNLLEDNVIIEKAEFVSGSVAIAGDFFKSILAGLRNLLGGEVAAYETVLDRGRREAILRLKESAIGADIILNLRIETSAIIKGCIETFAYGTAVYYKK